MPEKELIDLVRVWCVDCQQEADKEGNKFPEPLVRWFCHGCQGAGIAATESSSNVSSPFIMKGS